MDREGVLSIIAQLVGAVVRLPATVAATKFVTAPGSITAGIVFKRNGTIENQDGTNLGFWVRPAYATVGDNFDVKHTRTAGSAFSSAAGADDTYVNMNADRTWSNTKSTTEGAQTTTGTWSVRRKGVGSALVSLAGQEVRAEVIS